MYWCVIVVFLHYVYDLTNSSINKLKYGPNNYILEWEPIHISNQNLKRNPCVWFDSTIGWIITINCHHEENNRQGWEMVNQCSSKIGWNDDGIGALINYNGFNQNSIKFNVEVWF